MIFPFSSCLAHSVPLNRLDNICDRDESLILKSRNTGRTDSSFANDLADIKNMIKSLLADFSNKIFDLFGSKKPKLKLKKSRKTYREVIHNEELNFSEHTRKKFADDKKSIDETASDEDISDDDIFGDDKDSDKKSAVDWDDLINIDDKNFLEGFKLGIGLAFLSMALNGFTDDLLFNIPSSMLMWLLGALGAAIYLIPDEEIVSRKRRRRI